MMVFAISTIIVYLFLPMWLSPSLADGGMEMMLIRGANDAFELLSENLHNVQSEKWILFFVDELTCGIYHGGTFCFVITFLII